MTSNSFKCQQICKNTCASLNEALRKETAAVRYYESVIDDCHTPDIKQFIIDIAEARREEILRIISKLNEVHARSQVNDGVISSFD